MCTSGAMVPGRKIEKLEVAGYSKLSKLSCLGGKRMTRQVASLFQLLARVASREEQRRASVCRTYCPDQLSLLPPMKAAWKKGGAVK